jgi:hypothetical protein
MNKTVALCVAVGLALTACSKDDKAEESEATKDDTKAVSGKSSAEVSADGVKAQGDGKVKAGDTVVTGDKVKTGDTEVTKDKVKAGGVEVDIKGVGY